MHVTWPGQRRTFCSMPKYTYTIFCFDGGISDVWASRRDFVKVWGLWGKGACKYMFIDLPDATNCRPGAVCIPMYACMYVCMYVRTDANM